MTEELIDALRYSEKVQQLLVIASLKSLAHSVYVTAIEQKVKKFDLQCMKKQRSIHPVFLNFWIVIKTI